MMNARHGTPIRGCDTYTYRVFDPRWYRLDLWLRWLFTKRTKGVAVITVGALASNRVMLERRLRFWSEPQGGRHG